MVGHAGGDSGYRNREAREVQGHRGIFPVGFRFASMAVLAAFLITVTDT